MDYFVGVDVGSGSARAALVDSNGHILKVATKNISTWSPKNRFFQQSSEDIWMACCEIVKTVSSAVSPANIKGIGFDATCSLVSVKKNGEPVSISPNGEKMQNIIMWMDHRAEKEADIINQTRHSVLQYTGGKLSLEMQLPKLLWLKSNLNQCWNSADLFFDLPDYLTWRSTGCDSRSLCSVVCKWTYVGSPDGNGGWDEQFFKSIGLYELLKNNKIGTIVKFPGDPCGQGLTVKSANELGLLPNTPVGTSIIDAHAGGLGLIGCKALNVPQAMENRLSLICGTSTCHMAVNKKKLFVEGIWGPYYSAMVPGMWLNEAGQSATGKLIDHVINTHPAYEKIINNNPEVRVVDYLNQLLFKMANGKVDFLTKDLHIWPDFHGNRSPLADSKLKGISLDSSEENLALTYLATVQSLAYGTRHIIEFLENKGHSFETILICGGLSKNSLFVKTQANSVSKRTLVPKETESVLLGATILAAKASGKYSLEKAIENMSGDAEAVEPDLEVAEYHNKKYKVFKAMVLHQRMYQDIMNE